MAIDELTSQLPFPLNVYAFLLKRETGTVDYLHYGLFADANTPVEVAQERSTELLWAKLGPPCKLLEIGIGPGTTLARLAAAGFEATGITPDQTQIDWVRNGFPEKLSLQCCALEDFGADAGSWQVLLFQESSQYIHPVDLFERASQLLVADGEILILDEFSLKHDCPEHDNLHDLPHFIRLAERCGFSLTEQLDLTAQASPSLAWLVQALQHHRGALRTELGMTDICLDELEAENRRYQRNYADGHYGYFLLKLRLSEPKKYRLGRITDANAAEMRTLFAQVFGHEMSDSWWRWKYGQGRGDAIGLWQDGELVAHYGGAVRLLCHDGTVSPASQSCDVMVAPQARAKLSRRGPFFLVCATYLEQYVGYGNKCLLAYGFPNERAYRLPFKLGLYSEPVTRVDELSWSALSPRRQRRWTVCPLRVDDSAHCAALDLLWQTMQQGLKDLVLGVRDTDFWTQRYARHPQHQYHLLLVRHRWWRTPLAVLALKHDGDRMELVDWVAAPRHFPKVIAAARMLAAQNGSADLYLWASGPVAEQLAVTQPAIRELAICVPTNAWTNGPDPAVLQDRLWLTGGDTDFH